MNKKVMIIGGFAVLFAGALGLLYALRGGSEPVLEAEIPVSEAKEISDSLHTYTVADLNSGCAAEDKIFCAVEQTVKCTLAPDLDGCSKEVVPAFVLGKNDTPRPTTISFAITKIKPVPESTDISVFTTSDCDEVWFGLCKGTVIYSLTQKDGKWAVTNIFAME